MPYVKVNIFELSKVLTLFNCANKIEKTKTPDWDVIFDLTFHRLAFWLKSSIKNFSYTGSDLYRNPECIMN